MDFVTQFNFVPGPFESSSPDLVVERAGYISAQKQIENLIYSGQRLTAARMDEYGGRTDEEAEKDYTGIDTCDDLVDVDRCVQYAAQQKIAEAGAHTSGDDNNGVNGNSEVPVKE